MMKFFKKAAAVFLSAAILAAGTVSACAEEPPKVKKDENVYLILNADGSLSEQIVSVWLQAPDGLSHVKDVSNLKNVQNIKGNLMRINFPGNDIASRIITHLILQLNNRPFACPGYSLISRDHQPPDSGRPVQRTQSH